MLVCNKYNQLPKKSSHFDKRYSELVHILHRIFNFYSDEDNLC